MWTSINCYIHICFSLCGPNSLIPKSTAYHQICCAKLFLLSKMAPIQFSCAFMINDSLPPSSFFQLHQIHFLCRTIVYKDPHAQMRVRSFQMPWNNGFIPGNYSKCNFTLLHGFVLCVLSSEHLRFSSFSSVSALFANSWVSFEFTNHQSDAQAGCAPPSHQHKPL